MLCCKDNEESSQASPKLMLFEIENFQTPSAPDGEMKFLHSLAFLMCHISWVKPGADSTAEAHLILYDSLPSLPHPLQPLERKGFSFFSFLFFFLSHPLPAIEGNSLSEALISSPFKSTEA